MGIKYMDLDEFIEGGYLQEVNRRFLHPLGMALVVSADTDDDTGEVVGPWKISGVWDARDDSEGIYFDDETLDLGKATKVEAFEASRRDARQEALGYWVQPV